MRNPAVLGPDRGAFASNPGQSVLRNPGHCVSAATGTDQLCGRGLSRACVIEKNLAWSKLGQYHCLNYGAFPAQGLQREPGGFELQEGTGKAVSLGRWTPKS